jgi:hypothetical protein
MKKILVRNTTKNTYLFPNCIYKVPSEIFKNGYIYTRYVNYNAVGILIFITYKNE